MKQRAIVRTNETGYCVWSGLIRRKCGIFLAIKMHNLHHSAGFVRNVSEICFSYLKDFLLRGLLSIIDIVVAEPCNIKHTF